MLFIWGGVWREGPTGCGIGCPGRKRGPSGSCAVCHVPVHHSGGEAVPSNQTGLLPKGQHWPFCPVPRGVFIPGARAVSSDATRTASEEPGSASHRVKSCRPLCGPTMEGLETRGSVAGRAGTFFFGIKLLGGLQRTEVRLLGHHLDPGLRGRKTAVQRIIKIHKYLGLPSLWLPE